MIRVALLHLFAVACSADTTAAPEDTTVAPENTTVAPEDTTAAPEDTTVAPEDTTVAPEGLAAGDTSCYGAGSTIAERDAACAESLVCARAGFDSRDFGDCGNHHCCSNPQDTTAAPEDTTAAPEGVYVRGDLGDGDCPTGSAPLTTEAECVKAAATLPADFSNSGAYHWIHRGCNWFSTLNVYYFNNAAMGTGNANYAPVCVLQGEADLRVTSGSSCQIDGAGCVTDGAGEYDDGEDCTIEVLTVGTLSATEFDVEFHPSCNYDWIKIGDTKFCGSAGPSRAAVTTGSTFTWHSDSGTTNYGWTICLQPANTTAASEVTTAAPEDTTAASEVTTAAPEEAVKVWKEGEGGRSGVDCQRSYKVGTGLSLDDCKQACITNEDSCGAVYGVFTSYITSRTCWYCTSGYTTNNYGVNPDYKLWELKTPSQEVRFSAVDFDECCGSNSQINTFLQACTAAFAANYDTAATCTAVRQGSIILTLEGSQHTLDNAVALVTYGEGLQVGSYHLKDGTRSSATGDMIGGIDDFMNAQNRSFGGKFSCEEGGTYYSCGAGSVMISNAAITKCATYCTPDEFKDASALCCTVATSLNGPEDFSAFTNAFNYAPVIGGVCGVLFVCCGTAFFCMKSKKTSHNRVAAINAQKQQQQQQQQQQTAEMLRKQEDARLLQEKDKQLELEMNQFDNKFDTPSYQPMYPPPSPSLPMPLAPSSLQTPSHVAPPPPPIQAFAMPPPPQPPSGGSGSSSLPPAYANALIKADPIHMSVPPPPAAAPTKFCIHCGSAVKGGSVFCTKCGKHL